jgi:hypothetical protein
MKLLIVGDSFSADWTVKYKQLGWPNMLAQEFDVTNLSQAGCGEYKILLQLKSQDLSCYDAVFVSHTSPYRLHTAWHPAHHNDVLHCNSDFLYADVQAHQIKSVTEYFEKYFDLSYADFIHNLICKEIEEFVKPVRHIHMAHMKISYTFDNFLNCEPIHRQYPGFQNHYSDHGNTLVFEAVKLRLVNM